MITVASGLATLRDFRGSKRVFASRRGRKARRGVIFVLVMASRLIIIEGILMQSGMHLPHKTTQVAATVIGTRTRGRI